MNNVTTSQRMIERNQLRAMIDEDAERRALLTREINTRLNIVTV